MEKVKLDFFTIDFFCKHLTTDTAIHFGDTSCTLMALMKPFRNYHDFCEPRDTLKKINRLGSRPALVQ